MLVKQRIVTPNEDLISLSCAQHNQVRGDAFTYINIQFAYMYVTKVQIPKH